MATNQHPWIWAVCVFTVGLPIILFVSIMWPDKVSYLVKDTHIGLQYNKSKTVCACRGLAPLINSITTRSLMIFNQMILNIHSGQNLWIWKVILFRLISFKFF